jgi:hypothetical protein
MKAGNFRIGWHYVHRTIGCVVWNEKGECVGSDKAECSVKDHFCKDTGRKISLARAMKDAKLPKEERTVIWEIYRNMKPNKRW